MAQLALHAEIVWHRLAPKKFCDAVLVALVSSQPPAQLAAFHVQHVPYHPIRGVFAASLVPLQQLLQRGIPAVPDSLTVCHNALLPFLVPAKPDVSDTSAHGYLQVSQQLQ